MVLLVSIFFPFEDTFLVSSDLVGFNVALGAESRGSREDAPRRRAALAILHLFEIK